MLLGSEVCDGVVIKERCMNCYLQATGIKSDSNRKILIKASFFNLFRKLIPRLNQFDVKNNLLTTFKDKIRNIVVVSHWQKKVLELNGFNSNNIDVCRQAINEENILHQKTSQPSAKIRIGFIGRIVKVKGLHVLLNALNDLDKEKFELTVVAVKSANEIEYYNTTKIAANAINANWIEDLESSDIFKFLDNIDILAIPSIWLETGPIVAFEALARKLPLLAFNYGGVKELTNNSESFLVNSLEEMKCVLNEIINDKSKLQIKSDSIKYVRNTKDLYLESINLYNKISS
jgi:glycosyltransferase involved in cell wall biosynthesis